MIDCDGVLANYAKQPTKDMLTALDQLSKTTDVIVTSDRMRQDMAKWFEECKQTNLGAENGFFYRLKQNEW